MSIDNILYVADTGNQRVQSFSNNNVFLNKWGEKGSSYGQFDMPRGAAIASDGTIYVTDSRNHRVQHFASDGSFLDAWGSLGSGNGQFSGPWGIAVAPDGTIYVVDTNNHRIQRFSSTGVFLGKWGTYGSGDGQFNAPYGIAVASNGTVYVADTNNHRIQYFSATGQFLGKWGMYGSGSAQFNAPYGVSVSSGGTVYVADRGNNRIQYFSSIGTYLGKWGTLGSADGQLYHPYGVFAASDGSVYVADTENHRIQRFSGTGTFISKWGEKGSYDGQFSYLSDIVVAPNNLAYVVDPYNQRIQVFGTGYRTTWDGKIFGNDWLAEKPVAILSSSSLNFDWGDGSPDGVPIDHFSDRWRRYIYFKPGLYRFTIFTDDGVRFWIDKRLVLESWEAQRKTYTVDIPIKSGYHRLLVEHWENDGWAAISISWKRIGYDVFIPLVFKSYQAPWEQEPNNSYLEANGPLSSGREYYGYPNDEKDYFKVYLHKAGTIRINLEGHTGTGVQLQLFYQNIQNRVAYVTKSPYNIEYSGETGWYYIYIYTAGNYNSTTPYTLKVTYPK